jgi:hypothetical protein
MKFDRFAEVILSPRHGYYNDVGEYFFPFLRGVPLVFYRFLRAGSGGRRNVLAHAPRYRSPTNADRIRYPFARDDARWPRST